MDGFQFHRITDVVSCSSESLARSPLFDKVIQALSGDHITVKMRQLATDCFYLQMHEQNENLIGVSGTTCFFFRMMVKRQQEQFN